MQAEREEPAGDDADLLLAHAAGDAHAFARLYDRYDRPCFRYIRRMLGPAHAHDAEDLHQETWIAVSRNAGAFDARKASFRAWLFTIARNKVFDQLRRQRVAVLAPAEERVVMEAPDTGLTPLEQVEAHELARRLVAAVETLPLEQRGAFVLFADAGLSLEEVARVTGVGMETAKSRLRYARATLRRLLADERPAYV